MQVVENLTKVIFNIKEAFPHLSYQTAMSEYGSDKPDVRIKNTVSSRSITGCGLILRLEVPRYHFLRAVESFWHAHTY